MFNRYANILTEIQTNQSHSYNQENKIEDKKEEIISQIPEKKK